MSYPRNLPCVCGSGKKYKNCCGSLSSINLYNPKDTKKLTNKLVTWFTNEDRYNKDFKKYIKKFLGKESYLSDLSFSALLETFIYEGPLNLNLKPIDNFSNLPSLSKEEKQLYSGWSRGNILSIFEILALEPGLFVILKDLKTDKIYKCFESTATKQIDTNEIKMLVVRILPYKEQYMLSGGLLLPLPNEAAYLLSRNLTGDSFPSSYDLLKLFVDLDTKKPSSTYSVKDIEEDMDFENIKFAIEKRIAQFDLDIDLDQVDKYIQNFDFKKITECINSISRKIKNEEVGEELINLFNGYLQKHPKAGVEDIGPTEKLLLHQAVEEANVKIPLNLPDNLRQVEVNKFLKKWYFTEQKELDYKTPSEAVNIERKSLGLKPRDTPFELELSVLSDDKNNAYTQYYNSAVYLMQTKNDYLQALKYFDLAFAKFSSIPDKFRAYLNVGVCLLHLGFVDTAEKFFIKSLKENPNYNIAQRNLEETKRYKKGLVTFDLAPKSKIYFNLLKQNIIFFDITKSNFIQDALQFLNYIDKNGANITAVTKSISLKDVRKINQLFAIKTPDIEQFSKNHTIENKSEDRYDYVFLMHKLMLTCRFITIIRNKMILTPKGIKALESSKSELFTKTILFYLTKLNFKNLISPRREMFVDSEYTSFVNKLFKQNFSQFVNLMLCNKPLDAVGIFTHITGKSVFKDLVKDENYYYAHFNALIFEKCVLFPFYYFGVLNLTVKKVSKRKSFDGLMSYYSLTKQGKDLFAKIEKDYKNYIPGSIRNLL